MAKALFAESFWTRMGSQVAEGVGETLQRSVLAERAWMKFVNYYLFGYLQEISLPLSIFEGVFLQNSDLEGVITQPSHFQAVCHGTLMCHRCTTEFGAHQMTEFGAHHSANVRTGAEN